jgi:hypothetical protein
MAMGGQSGPGGPAGSAGHSPGHGASNSGVGNGRNISKETEDRQSQYGRGGRIKKKKPLVYTTKTWQPPQFIKGIKHNVEGYTGVTKKIQSGGIEGYEGDLANRSFNIPQEKAYNDAIASFQRKQKLRMSIPSLPDSEALNLEGQKEAVRKRMRSGRSGTMLSERETLG